MGEPVTVAMAPPEIRGWGPWQFPHLGRLSDGRIQVTFHVEADSAAAYGLPAARAVSDDEGRTWTMLPREETGGRRGNPMRLPNGDWLCVARLRPIPMAKLDLPEKPFYLLEEVPEECRAGWPLFRLRAGETQWVEEQATVNLPGETRGVNKGLLVLPFFDRLLLAPDGAVWAVNYCGSRRIVDGELRERSTMMILRSVDHGKTWDLWSELPYAPDPYDDPYAEARNGFTEPVVNFMPDGSVFCLLRTTDARGVGPMYWARSTDDGRTWTEPRVFDDLGVYPQMLTLENGVTLAMYGRPGLYVRATSDPSGLRWDKRVEILPPVWNTTCAYGAMLPLDDDSVLVAYSQFDLSGPDGQPRKGIRVRRLTVRPAQ